MSEPAQEPIPSSGSSPSERDKRVSDQHLNASGASKLISTRTEYPKLPRGVRSSFAQPATEEVEVGNKRYDFIQMNEGFVGHKFRRTATAEQPTYVEIDVDVIATCMKEIFKHETTRILKNKGVLSTSEIQRRVNSMSDTIINGCRLMIYLKMQELHFTLLDEYDKFAESYRVKDNFELPLPYALCIQQLGLVKIASLTEELHLAPTVRTQPTRFMIEPGSSWSLSEHNEYVDYMKSLGMRFAQVNPKVKMGSTWWLYRQRQIDGILCLACPLPESNFTESGAVIHSMFFDNIEDPTGHEIADLSPIGNKFYGMMMRNPRCGIQLSSFRALCNEEHSIW
uniref:Coat protein n=1 Tax=Port Orford cedar deltapartitivirus TaxID=2933095 RepID=A0A9C7GWN5_9VIRU|nr:putative coat protein [Port Orford cedar deltapartitivirus]CAI5383893.1 putative coat protein [Port Orford cedar deltapartitivirus]